MPATSTIIATTMPVPSDGDLEHRRLHAWGSGAPPIQCITASSNACVPPARTCSAISANAQVQTMAIAAPDSRKIPKTA